MWFLRSKNLLKTTQNKVAIYLKMSVLKNLRYIFKNNSDKAF